MNRERNRPPRSEADDVGDAFDDETILQGYLARLMTMQDERADTWLEEADLQEAARDLGLSADDLARLDAAIEGHRQRGRSFAERRLWDEAIEAFEQASVLRPLDAALAHDLALAYLGRWRIHGGDDDRQAADRFAHRTLQLDPEHAASYEVLQELKRRPVRTETPSRGKVNLSMSLLFGAMALAVFLALLLLFVL